MTPVWRSALGVLVVDATSGMLVGCAAISGLSDYSEEDSSVGSSVGVTRDATESGAEPAPVTDGSHGDARAADAAAHTGESGADSSAIDVDAEAKRESGADCEAGNPDALASGESGADTGTADDASTSDGVVGAGGCDAAVAVCDPVHNTGCNALLQQQCDVNPLVTTMPTGMCLFNSGSEAGGACIGTAVSESCPPRSTCVSGACRTLCFCNADCSSGQCCSDTSGPPGFTLCAPCR